MTWVETMCKSERPDIVVLDMGDKFARQGSYSRPDEMLKANAIYARQIAKTYGVLYSTCHSCLLKQKVDRFLTKL